jgi:hypothetical protein
MTSPTHLASHVPMADVIERLGGALGEKLGIR